MYNVLDVAIYVINYAHDADYGESMSNLKLQKILYYGHYQNWSGYIPMVTG